MKGLYFDYAASTPVDPRVERAMRPYFLQDFGNPGSLHSFGQRAIAAVDAARETIAKHIGAEFREVIFTGSATEANNLALRGAIDRWKDDMRAKGHKGEDIRPRIIVGSIEHESVLETAHDLEGKGVEVIYVPVDREGVLDVEAIGEAINERTVLI